MSRRTGNSRPGSLFPGLVFLVAVASSPVAARGTELPPPSQAPEPAEPTVAQTAAPVTGRGAAFALQGGWWSAEAEWRTRFGGYAAAGIPWGMAAMSVVNGATWVVPLTGRVGYDVALSPRWSLRASGHATTTIANETSKCGCGNADRTWRTFLFAELGVHYQSPSGLVAGADLPVVGLRTPHHGFPPPFALAFTQVYLGYSWGR
jgi:hypothetical protein